MFIKKRYGLIIIVSLVFLLVISYSFYEIFFYKLKNYAQKNLINSSSQLVKTITQDINMRIRDIDNLSTYLLEGKKEIPLSHILRNELLGLVVFEKSNDTYKIVSNFKNSELFKRSLIDENILFSIYEKYKLPLDSFFQVGGVLVINRSVAQRSIDSNSGIPIVTFLIPVSTNNDEKQNLVIVADFLMNFLISGLRRIEGIESFIMSFGGKLVASFDPLLAIEFSDKEYNHPAFSHLGKDEIKVYEIGNTIFNITPIGYRNLFLVSQINHKRLSDWTIIFRENWWMYLFIIIPFLVVLFLVFVLAEIFFMGKSSLKNKKELDLVKPNIDIEVPEPFKKLLEQLSTLKKAFLGSDHKVPEEIRKLTLSMLKKEKPQTQKKYTRYNLSCFHKEKSLSFWYHHEDSLRAVFVVGSVYSKFNDFEFDQTILMLLLTTIKRVVSKRLFSIELTLSRLNEVIFSCFNGDFSLSMTIGELNFDNRNFSYFVAGGFEPFFEDQEKILKRYGKVLGLDIKNKFEMKTIRIEKNFCLFNERSDAVTFQFKTQDLKNISTDYCLLVVKMIDEAKEDISIPKMDIDFNLVCNDPERREEFLYGEHSYKKIA